MHMIQWNKMAEKKPEPGQLCVIKFVAKNSSLRLVRYDNMETWKARTLKDIDEEEISDDLTAWFTEADDDEDWWEPQYVEQWMPVPPPLVQA